MRNTYVILSALLVLVLFSNAHSAPERTCRIVFLDRPAGAPKLLQLFDGKNFQEVELPSMNLSPLYKLSPEAIELKLLSAKVEDPNEISPDTPMVEIPRDYTNFVLLVLSDLDNKIAPVKMEAVNLAGDNFKIGQTLWTNQTDMVIEAKLGKQVLSLDALGSKIMDSPLSDEGVAISGYYNATFTYQPQPNGDFAPITEQQWWHDADSRHLGFIVNTGGKLPKIYFFRDFRLPQE